MLGVIRRTVIGGPHHAHVAVVEHTDVGKPLVHIRRRRHLVQQVGQDVVDEEIGFRAGRRCALEDYESAADARIALVTIKRKLYFRPTRKRLEVDVGSSRVSSAGSGVHDPRTVGIRIVIIAGRARDGRSGPYIAVTSGLHDVVKAARDIPLPHDGVASRRHGRIALHVSRRADWLWDDVRSAQIDGEHIPISDRDVDEYDRVPSDGGSPAIRARVSIDFGRR
jgi:hypothetical protein